jgi:hypothetical protein
MFRSRKGQQMVEYLLLLAGIIVVFFAALYGNNTFRNRVTSIIQSCLDFMVDETGNL